MPEDIAPHHRPEGVALSHQALSPKRGGGWHTMWWTGPNPDHPGAAIWTGNPGSAAVYPTETAAVDAFAALDNRRYRLPPPQLQLDDIANEETHRG